MSEYIVDMYCEAAGVKCEEIVRCKDCRHYKPGEEQPPVDWCCYFHDEVTPLGFCAWGERSEE